jgi:hypothetical protein
MADGVTPVTAKTHPLQPSPIHTTHHHSPPHHISPAYNYSYIPVTP